VDVYDRPRGVASGLAGRRAECGVLDGLLAAVRAGESRVLLVHGEPGVGKTALLEYLADRCPHPFWVGWAWCRSRSVRPCARRLA
jgi:hypothetical protein